MPIQVQLMLAGWVCTIVAVYLAVAHQSYLLALIIIIAGLALKIWALIVAEEKKNL